MERQMIHRLQRQDTDCEAVVQKALSFVGYREPRKPHGGVIFNTDYYGREVFGKEYAWCVTFLWDVFRMAGYSHCFFDGERTDECVDVLRWGRENGLLISTDEARRGDIALYCWDGSKVPGHIGLLLERRDDGSFLSVEGNTSDWNDPDGGCVMIRPRKPEWIVAIIRPEYGRIGKDE